jgi:arylsulfatase A-like enzyme
MIAHTAWMRCAAALVILVCLGLGACEDDPRSIEVVSTDSAYLGLPDRTDPPTPELALDITALLEVPRPSLMEASPDSVSMITSGGSLRVDAELPALDARDIAGLRLGWRGTLGGDLSLSWIESPGKGRLYSLDAVQVPGGATEASVEIGFGSTRILGPRIAEVGIEIPSTEAGLVVLSRVELVLRPGRIPHRVSIGGEVREVLAPGSSRSLEWDVEVPSAGVVEFEYGTHPLMRSAHGDGTRFVAEVVDSGRPTVVLDRWLSIYSVPEHRRWHQARVDLARWAGKEVVLRLSSKAGPDASGVFPASAVTRDDEPLFTIPRLVNARDVRPNVLVIVIDTLRRDALGSFGGGPSPALDSLAARGVRFDRAWANGSWTHPSTVSLLSGWLPSRHGLGHGPAGTTRMAPGTPLVALDFRAAGWATAAASNNKIVSVAEGFAQGFVAYDERAFSSDQVHGGERITRAARSWLDAHPDGPFFLYLHYFDPHDRYQAPAPFTREHIPASLEQRVKDSSVRGGRPNPFTRWMTPDARELTSPELSYMQGLYQGEVSYVDHCIGQLLGHLESGGRLDNTIVVVTSDHGEEFLEHGGLKHAHTLYEELVAVPLMVRLPGDAHAGSVVSTPVSLTDLPATLRRHAGLPARSGDRAWPLSGGSEGGPVLAQNWWEQDESRAGLQAAIIEWPWKLIRYEQDPAELFDLGADPGELAPVGDVARAERMSAMLDSLLGDADIDPGQRPVDPGLIEKLKAMGYVH